LQSDIVYTSVITANAGQSTAFITFNAATVLITWTAPTVAGVFTVAVTGQITNAAGIKTAMTNFVLTVYSCTTSIDTIAITPSVPTSVSMPLLSAISGS